MYCQHFDLKKKPFCISPDERFLWLGKKHLHAISTLQYAIQENKGFLALTGDVGAGKTALIYGLIKKLPKNVIVATINNPDLKSTDFYKVLAKEFDINRPINGKAGFLIIFKQFLQAAFKSDKIVLLIIDEAHQLNFKLLDEIRMLSNLAQDHHRLLNIFFIGQSELNNILLDKRCRSVRQRIAIKYHIKSLDVQETAEYIRHRLKIAKGNQEIFLSDAVKYIYRFSNGNPRMINIICDHALLTGYIRGCNFIDGAIIKECASELDISRRIEKDVYKNKLENSEPLTPVDRTQKPSPSNRPFFWAVITGSAALCLLILFIFGSQKSLIMTTDHIVEVDSFKESSESASTNTDLKSLDFLVSFKETSMELEDDTFTVLNKVANLMNKHPAAEIILVKNRNPKNDSTNNWRTGYSSKTLRKTSVKVKSNQSVLETPD